MKKPKARGGPVEIPPRPVPTIQRKISVLVFDFDNTITIDPETGTGSEEVKQEAWYQVFAEYPRRRLAPILKLAHESIRLKGDRNDVAAYVLRALEVPETGLADEVSARCDRFNTYVQEGIQRLGVHPIQRLQLKAWAEAGVPMYMNTATPAEAVSMTLEMLGIASYFRRVYGSRDLHGKAMTKTDNLRKIQNLKSYPMSEICMVGDSTKDLKASKEAGCQFIGIHTAAVQEWHNPAVLDFLVVRSFAEISLGL